MGIKIVCQNRKAEFNYFILERFEAGIELKGTEVKSLRDGKASLTNSYARVENEEVFLYQCHIAMYVYGNRFNHDPLVRRRLLLHKEEIRRLIGKTKEKGLTLIPTKIYFKNNRAKVELALAKGKKIYDKREDIKKKISEREIAKAFRRRQKMI